MTALEVLSVLFAIAALFGSISVRMLKLPITVGTMLLTVLASAALMGASQFAPHFHRWALDLVHQIDFESVMLHGMLPLLLFAGAFLLDLDQLAREKLAVSLLSVVGTVLSVFLVAGLMFLMSGLRIPWMQCLIFGALISPTDPIAVLEMLRRSGAAKQIQAQLAGESLFNDGIGAVLFLTMLDVARGAGTHSDCTLRGFLLLEGRRRNHRGPDYRLDRLAPHAPRRTRTRSTFFSLLPLPWAGMPLPRPSHLSAPLEAVVAGIFPSLLHWGWSLPSASHIKTSVTFGN